MKKIVLSLATVLVATAFAPEASALPVFARQTGMACSACHFQHFPLLNGFGRAFKAAGFTMMGAQAKVEGEGLSIPETLNMAVLTSVGYEKTNMAADTSGVQKNTGNGAVFVPGVLGEASLFFGGHVSENAGFLAELGLGGGAAALGSAKLPVLFEVGSDGVRVGVVPFATDAQGASYGMELLNTGANAIHVISNTPGFNGAHQSAISAQQYIGTGGLADGAALVATSDKFFINLTKYQQTGIALGAPSSLGSTYLRAAVLFDLAGWDSAVGVQSWQGQSQGQDPNTGGTTGVAAALLATGLVETKATAIDGQMQGELGGKPVGFYFSYANAPVATAGVGASAFNQGGTFSKSALNLNAEVGVVPEVVTLAAAIRRGKAGVADSGNANATDNAIYVTASYKIQQNMLARISYTTNSGSYWNTANTNATGSKTTTINVYTLF